MIFKRSYAQTSGGRIILETVWCPVKLVKTHTLSEIFVIECLPQL